MPVRGLPIRCRIDGVILLYELCRVTVHDPQTRRALCVTSMAESGKVCEFECFASAFFDSVTLTCAFVIGAFFECHVAVGVGKKMN